MAMAADEIAGLIRQNIPDALVEITDLAGDGDHFAARVVSESFRGLPRVKDRAILVPTAEDDRAIRLPIFRPQPAGKPIWATAMQASYSPPSTGRG